MRLFESFESLNGNQFYFKYQSSIRWDGAIWIGIRTVRQFLWDEEFGLASGLHQLKALCPSFDDTAQREGDGFTSLVGGIEFGSVD